jgi:hypothetical protein
MTADRVKREASPAGHVGVPGDASLRSVQAVVKSGTASCQANQRIVQSKEREFHGTVELRALPASEKPSQPTEATELMSRAPLIISAQGESRQKSDWTPV